MSQTFFYVFLFFYSCLTLEICFGEIPNWLKNNCGIRAKDPLRPFIPCGDDASSSEYPWQVSVYYKGSFDGHWCGGILITPRHVLSSAHCFQNTFCSRQKDDCDKSNFVVHVGRTNRTDVYDRETGRKIYLKDDNVIRRQISKLAVYGSIHHKFDYFGGGRDISFIELNEDVPWNENIVPICIPDEDTQYLFEPGKTVFSSGFGNNASGLSKIESFPYQLQQISLTVLTKKECDEEVKKLGVQEISDDFLCSRSTGDSCSNGFHPDTCSGDSGGPLMAPNRKTNQWVIGGIVSFGLKECGRISSRTGNRAPAFFTSVYHHKNWILKLIDILTKDSPLVMPEHLNINGPSSSSKDKTTEVIESRSRPTRSTNSIPSSSRIRIQGYFRHPTTKSNLKD